MCGLLVKVVLEQEARLQTLHQLGVPAGTGIGSGSAFSVLADIGIFQLDTHRTDAAHSRLDIQFFRLKAH